MTTLAETPRTLPAGSRLRCLRCGSQWEHGAWSALEHGVELVKGTPMPAPHACPMCAEPLAYAAGRYGFYELGSQAVYYD